MSKVKQRIFIISYLVFCWGIAVGQTYKVSYTAVDFDTATLRQKVALQADFISRADALSYVTNLPSLLHSKGWITASLDAVSLDSTKGNARLFLGEQYRLARIATSPNDEAILQAVRWPSTALAGTVDFNAVSAWQQRILDYLEETGYPFGKTYLDSITINEGIVSARLAISPGPVYKIDSIRLYGDAKINNEFLQKYLLIENGSVYNKTKLQNISKKLSELNYIEETRPSDLTLLATGSVLNLYLKQKRSSQVNALIGFLPNSDPLLKRKLLLTVDANVLLRNALGSGETIGLLWQQLQAGSPRLNLLYEQPYIFHSPFGLGFTFDMYKQDTNFLNINMKLAATYKVGTNQAASVFLLKRQTIVNGINAAAVIQNRSLPAEADVSSFNLGFTYEYFTTDYRFNPRKGNELSITSSAGNKRLKKNNLVLELKDPSDPNFKFEHLYDTVKLNAYQFRVNATAAHYIQVGKQSTVKLGLNGGIYQSANFFRNELFQIGGYKLMRGFNEESQYVSKYAIGTAEYRYLIGLNSAFFVFVDGGWGNHLLETVKNHTYLGTGLGLSFETKAGIINLAWAVGKRDDVDFNLRQSKIHLGFASYF